MFVSANQICFFIESLFIGVVLGSSYELFFIVKSIFKQVVIRQIIDFLFCIVAIVLYFCFSEIFCFPNFRLYLFCGVLIGFLIYLLSFHKTLAKVIKLVYNKTISFIRRKTRERKQKAKARFSSDGNVDNNSLFLGAYIGLPIRKHWRKKQGKKRP